MLIQTELKVEEVEEAATPRCPSCGDTCAESRSITSHAVYLQCASCRHTWSMSDRRKAMRSEDYRKRF
jgi:tRNA(Ile2) C34 agmatinyltransferase TiaS